MRNTDRACIVAAMLLAPARATTLSKSFSSRRSWSSTCCCAATSSVAARTKSQGQPASIHKHRSTRLPTKERAHPQAKETRSFCVATHGCSMSKVISQAVGATEMPISPSARGKPNIPRIVSKLIRKSPCNWERSHCTESGEDRNFLFWLLCQLAMDRLITSMIFQRARLSSSAKKVHASSKVFEHAARKRFSSASPATMLLPSTPSFPGSFFCTSLPRVDRPNLPADSAQ